MTRNEIPLVVVAVVFAMCGSALADFGPTGVDSSALGKGGAHTSEARGPSAVYWNPAGVGRSEGVLGVFSFGMLQRPDFGSNEFGSTERLFLAGSYGFGKEDALPEGLGLGAAIERPFPRFDYAARGGYPLGGGSVHRLGATVSQDYLEVLVAAGFRPLEADLLGGKGRLFVGMNLGLGFAYGNTSGDFRGPSVPGITELSEGKGTALLFPAGLGTQFTLSLDEIDLSLGVRYRGVMPLVDPVCLSFPRAGVDLAYTDLFMPPPQEGAVGLSVVFFDRLLHTLELSWYFFDGPDAFPNVVPHNYPVIKYGFEYRVPFDGDKKEIAMRFGLSSASVPENDRETIYTNSATGIYFGWGLELGPLACFDAYFTLQIPGEGDVDSDTFLASVSYGVRF